jgi:hypothetical protein
MLTYVLQNTYFLIKCVPSNLQQQQQQQHCGDGGGGNATKLCLWGA